MKLFLFLIKTEVEIEVGGNIRMSFFFPVIDVEELEQIQKCKEFIQDFQEFYINCAREKWGDHRDIELNIILNVNQKKVLDKKLEVLKSTKNFNI